MNAVEGYLDDEYYSDKQELTEITQLVARDLVPVFAQFVVTGSTTPVSVRAMAGTRWPYEIYDVRARRVVDPVQYSQSTSAMIIFALAALVSRLMRGSLLRSPELRIPLEDTLKSRVGATITEGIASLAASINAEAARGRNCTFSGTFGRNDPLTLSWALPIMQLVADRRPTRRRSSRPASVQALNAVKAAARSALNTAKKRPQGPHFTFASSQRGSEALEHSFPLLRVVFLQETLQSGSATLWSVTRYFLDRLHTQLSQFDIPGGAFDPAELAFSLEGALICNAPAVDRGTADRVFKVLRQHEYWRAVHPTVVTPQGNLHVPISVEIASSLLRSCDRLDDSSQLTGHGGTYFAANLDLFRRYVQWLMRRLVRGRARTAAGNVAPFAGWRSEHSDAPGSIHLWYTSQGMLFLAQYAAMLREHIAARALRSAGLTASVVESSDTPQVGSWRTLALAMEPAAGRPTGSAYRYWERVGAGYVSPRESPKRGEAQFSMLLYGPPGTGKTSAAEKLASALQYRLIQITPSDFIRRGEAEVEARAKRIFEALKDQSRVVIVFDEIDRMILDRDSIMYLRQGDVFQFMTPGMLTKLNELRKIEQPIFIIATNYAERIDRAIKRLGRIDQQFLVLPPDAQRRMRMLDASLRRSAVRDLIGRLSDVRLRQLLNPVVAKTVLFITKELDHVVKEAVARGPHPTTERLSESLLKAADETKPIISLGSYRNRFKLRGDATLETADEPVEEFLLLVYLVLEAYGAISDPEERELVRTVLVGYEEPADSEMLRKKVRARLQLVRDEDIRRALLEFARGLDWVP